MRGADVIQESPFMTLYSAVDWRLCVASAIGARTVAAQSAHRPGTNVNHGPSHAA